MFKIVQLKFQNSQLNIQNYTTEISKFTTQIAKLTTAKNFAWGEGVRRPSHPPSSRLRLYLVNTLVHFHFAVNLTIVNSF